MEDTPVKEATTENARIDLTPSPRKYVSMLRAIATRSESIKDREWARRELNKECYPIAVSADFWRVFEGEE